MLIRICIIVYFKETSGSWERTASVPALSPRVKSRHDLKSFRWNRSQCKGKIVAALRRLTRVVKTGKIADVLFRFQYCSSEFYGATIQVVRFIQILMYKSQKRPSFSQSYNKGNAELKKRQKKRFSYKCIRNISNIHDIILLSCFFFIIFRKS